MGNFGFLNEFKIFEPFAGIANEAEQYLNTSPPYAALLCRKALEKAIRWFYDMNYIMVPQDDRLMVLYKNPDFRSALKQDAVYARLKRIIEAGNAVAHDNYIIQKKDAQESILFLFSFMSYLDFRFGSRKNHSYDPNLVPPAMVAFDPVKLEKEKELVAALEKAQTENEELKKQIEEQNKINQEVQAAMAALQAQLEEEKKKNQQQGKEPEPFVVDELSEYKTRKIFIDIDLEEMGWVLKGEKMDVLQEYEVNDMEGHIGQLGYVDYVLFDNDGLPLAVVEAKKTSKDPNVGRIQAKLYTDCLERKFGRRPFMFTTNGFDTYFWDDKTAPQRKVSMIFSKSDLQKLMLRRENLIDLNTVQISDQITDRYYQKEAIRAVCENTMKGFRKNLLVMATGTGKTRTASSLVDVMSRGNYITNVLFLADRIALVKQAKDDFKNYLPDMSLCNLLDNKDDKNARIVFSTYPTILNTIDTARTKDGRRMFTPAHFDLIIIDEAHRSIFKKYKAIFEYFDAILVGLTATPKKDVDKNTYAFFGMDDEDPTYVYEYEKARDQDKVLVPYYNIEVSTKFMHDGISYDELSPEDKEQYEAVFAEDEELPSFVSAEKLNKTVFNRNTIDIMLQDLMNRGIKVGSGDRLAKTIIFAQNKRHAEFILSRFNALYPEYHGTFAQRVICDDSYAQSVIDDFKQPAPPTQYSYDEEKEPHIVISVDMMDTGIDVPHIGNLVFFKEVFSKSKFWQMIGRGTRKCKGMECVDSIDGAYTDKRRFFIFDYCMNFEFFRAHQEGIKGKETVSLTESIFGKRVRIIEKLQDPKYSAEKEQAWREKLVKTCQDQIQELKDDLIVVKLEKQYVEKYRRPDAFRFISENDRKDLIAHIAPLVRMDEQDVMAKRFDNFIYGLILAFMTENAIQYAHYRGDLEMTADALARRSAIPQIKEKMPVIQEIYKEDFWENADILWFENIRKELRNLIQFIERKETPPIYTSLTDYVLTETSGKDMPSSSDYRPYRQRVELYIQEHHDNTAIHKLMHNIPMTEEDYKNLEKVLTVDLGNEEDYQKNYGETPFGLLVRKIAKLDHQAAMDAFSGFINDQSLNSQQIDFVHKVITYIENNGYMEDLTVLLNAPFEKPVSFQKLFDIQRQIQLRDAILQVKDNALLADAL